jgi:hypothetical protein
MLLGINLYVGTPSSLGSFKLQTGATYPLLIDGSSEAGGNVSTLYGPYDNYLVLDRTGTVRYHADIEWDHGNRYHLDQIRHVVDSLLAVPVGVGNGEDPRPRAPLLEALPNPFESATTIGLTNPADRPLPARILVLDVHGRRIATLLEASVAPGRIRTRWNGVTDRGEKAPSGVYLIRAELGGLHESRRVVLVR